MNGRANGNVGRRRLVGRFADVHGVTEQEPVKEDDPRRNGERECDEIRKSEILTSAVVLPEEFVNFRVGSDRKSRLRRVVRCLHLLRNDRRRRRRRVVLLVLVVPEQCRV